MIHTEIIGFAAGFLTTIALLPQAIKSWKTKSTEDVSFWWLLTLILGNILWIAYGVIINSMPVLIANVFTGLFALTTLILKIRYG